MTVSTAPVIYGDFAGNEIRGPLGNTFNFVVDPACPDQETVTIDIMITDDGAGEWTGVLDYTIGAPVISIVGLFVDDTAGGDGDSILEPGESAEVEIHLANTGHESMTNAQATLISGHAMLTVTQDQAGVVEIPVGGEVVLTPAFSLDLDLNYPSPGVVACLLNVDADWLVTASLNAPVGIGGFFDNTENGEGAWTHEIVTPGYFDQWHLSTTRNHTPAGSASWKFGATDASDYVNQADGVLVTEPITVAETTVITFWHWIDAEVSSAYPGKCYDGGLVEVSYDAGAWLAIEPDGGYPYTIRAGSAPGPFAEDTPVFSGQQDWTMETFTLNTTPGSVQFRFRFGSDGASGGEGWYVDDVHLISWSELSDVEIDERLTMIPVLGANHPNPFSPETRIGFRLPLSADVRLTVHDLEGRLVRILLDDTVAGGNHQVTWDGRDESGLIRGAGVYFYRLESEGERWVRKMTLLR